MIAPSQLSALISEISTPNPARMARLPRRHRVRVESAAEVAIRVAGADDADAVCTLEQLDDHALPAGPRLLAELDGVPVAALAVTDGSVVADPFARTAGVVDLLRVRARQLRVAA